MKRIHPLWLSLFLLTAAGCDKFGLEPRFKGVPPVGLQPAFDPFKALGQLGEDTGREVEALRRDAEQQLRRLASEIEKLKDQAEDQGQRAGGSVDRTVERLETRRRDLERQLQASGKAGEEMLQKIGRAIEDAVEEAKRAGE
ncbi:MAG: hypothetical protein M3Y59_22115 [Myxococcota bacterium]|nr:hypothetical protein [Myxococcota bacterium]